MKHPLYYVLTIILVFSISSDLYGQRPFITKWNTENRGDSCSSCVVIRIHPEEIYNYDIDWDNDGVYDELNVQQDAYHDYETEGIYTVAIRGVFPRTRFFASDYWDSKKLVSIVQWGDIKWSSMGDAFSYCENMIYEADDSPDLSEVTSLHGMFKNCKNFTGDINDWDVSNVSDVSHMFEGCDNFNGELNDWDVSNITNFSNMFQYAESFNQSLNSWDVAHIEDFSFIFHSASSFNQSINDWDVSNAKNMSNMFTFAKSFNQELDNWDVSKVTDMSEMFHGCNSFNQNIGIWNVSNVTNMYRMFMFCSEFNQDIGGWDVSNVTNMSGMFLGNVFTSTNLFNQDIGSWDVSSVTDMSAMFSYAGRFNQDISNWDVSNVTDMRGMFSWAFDFNQDIGGWNVSNVTNMADMFWDYYIGALEFENGTISFNQDISEWDVSNVKDMSNMFYRAEKFNQNLGLWNLESVEDISGMFNYTGMYCISYSETLQGWADAGTTPHGLKLESDGLRYSSNAAIKRAKLINEKGWTITGDALGNCTTSTTEIYENQFSVYPTIVDNNVTIESNSNQKVRIYNSIGQIVNTIEVRSGESTHTLSVLTTGVFFMTPENGKIIKLVKR